MTIHFGSQPAQSGLQANTLNQPKSNGKLNAEPKFGLISDQHIDSFEDMIEDTGLDKKQGILGRIGSFAIMALAVLKGVKWVYDLYQRFLGGGKQTTQPDREYAVKNTEAQEAEDEKPAQNAVIEQFAPIHDISHVRQVTQHLDAMLKEYDEHTDLDVDQPINVTVGDILHRTGLPWNADFINDALYTNDGEADENEWLRRFNKTNQTTVGSLDENVTMRQMIEFTKALKREEAKNLVLVPIEEG